MTTYYSDRVVSATSKTFPARYTPEGMWMDSATYEANTVASGDVIQMLKVNGAQPGGVTVVELILTYDDCGTGTAGVGDGDATSGFMASVDIGAAGGGVARRGAGVTVSGTTGFPKTYTVDDTIDVIISSGTGLAGTITLTAFFQAGT